MGRQKRGRGLMDNGSREERRGRKEGIRRRREGRRGGRRGE